MNKKYHVIWFDDEHEDRKLARETAHLKGITLVGFGNAEEGILELEQNINSYDAAVLDGIFYETPSEIGTPTKDEAMGKVATTLIRLEERKKLPWFILSGQDSFTKNKNRFAEAFKNGKVYDKLGGEQEYEDLWNKLIVEADKLPETQARHKYQRVFDVCNERYIGELAAQDLLKLLNPNNELDLNGQFNTIRKIIEDIFIAFNKFQLLPNEFITPSVALNESSKFLSGKSHKGELFTEKGYQHGEETHLPDQISKLLWNILNITQDGSHRSTVDEHVKILNTSYLIQSVLFQLLDVIVWFKIHIDSDPIKENWTNSNSSQSAQESTQKTGYVINLNIHKGFAFFKPNDCSENIFIPPHLVTNHSLIDDDEISVEIEEYQDNRTYETKKRVKKIIE